MIKIYQKKRFTTLWRSEIIGKKVRMIKKDDVYITRRGYR